MDMNYATPYDLRWLGAGNPKRSSYIDEADREESLEEISERVGRWMPGKGQKYWTFEADYSDIYEDTWTGCSDEVEAYELGIVFKTADEAQTALRKLEEVNLGHVG